MSSIVTKTGDQGQTSLIDGIRLSKGSLQVESYGLIDELQAGILDVSAKDSEHQSMLLSISQVLVDVMAQLASGPIKDYESSIKALEDFIYQHPERFQGFIYHFRDELGYKYNLLRTVCRRAERGVIRFFDESKDFHVLDCARYLNRLSDFFYVLSLEYTS